MRRGNAECGMPERGVRRGGAVIPHSAFRLPHLLRGGRGRSYQGLLEGGQASKFRVPKGL